jgi:double zinc ribbon protein
MEQLPDSRCVVDGCQQDPPKGDKFCSRCGYATKKCPACGKRLPKVRGNFCPSCGAARSGQQVVRTPPLSGRARVINAATTLVAAPVIVLLIVGFILSQPTVSRATAQGFFDNYFNNVENPAQRAQLYAHDLTTSFKQLKPNKPGEYNNYWNTVKSVDVGPAYSISGNSFEFTVSFTVHYKTGGSEPVRENFWFVCTGFRGTMMGRFPWTGCPGWALQIDSEQVAPLPTGSG